MDKALEIINKEMERRGLRPPKPRTGPIICKNCGKEWLQECDCDKTNITRNILAFHDAIGGTYKVWSCEDSIFLEHERDKKSEHIIFIPSELTRLAREWLALQDNDYTIHEHCYKDTLDPRYEACSCGAARHKE